MSLENDINQAVSEMGSTHIHVREKAFRRLAALKDGLETLIDRFQTETDPGLRGWLLELIGRRSFDDCFETVVSALGDPSAYVRAMAVELLTDSDRPAAAEALELALYFRFDGAAETLAHQHMIKKALARIRDNARGSRRPAARVRENIDFLFYANQFSKHEKPSACAGQ